MIWCNRYLARRILSELSHSISLIYPGALRDLVEIASAQEPEPPEEAGSSAEPYSQAYLDGIVVLRLHGIMARMEGAINPDTVAEDLVSFASEDVDTVRGIILDVDSPGGLLDGIPELARVVAEASRTKPIFAWANGTMASAAYWAASGASAIYARPSAEVGSIGVYLAMYDLSRMYEAAGVKVDVFASGPYKGIGIEGTSLTDDQKKYLQESVNRIFRMFAEHVRRERSVSDDVMQGKIYLGEDAIANSLADETADTLWDVVRELNVYLG